MIRELIDFLFPFYGFQSWGFTELVFSLLTAALFLCGLLLEIRERQGKQ